MSASIQGQTQSWFTINEEQSKAVIASAPIDVRKITAVAFDVDVILTVGELSFGFELSAYTPLGLDDATQTIKIDVDANMFAMDGR